MILAQCLVCLKMFEHWADGARAPVCWECCEVLFQHRYTYDMRHYVYLISEEP